LFFFTYLLKKKSFPQGGSKFIEKKKESKYIEVLISYSSSNHYPQENISENNTKLANIHFHQNEKKQRAFLPLKIF